ncbi:MAG: sialidase family protein [Candidatus Sulfotelmatobacter sp.]
MPVRHQLKANTVACVALVFAFAFCTTIATAQNPLGLPVSPKSGSVLVGEAIHSGALQLAPSYETSLFEPALTCSPVPCVLPNVQASGGTNIANEDPIVVNPKNPSQILTGANDYSCSVTLQGFYASSDGGSTWTRTCLPAISGGSGLGDPMVGYDLLGNAFAGGIQSGPPGQVIVVANSTNNGTTWSTPAVAVKPTISGGFTDKGWLQIDTTAASPHVNCLYVSNTQFDSTGFKTQISVSHSCDHGTTWKTATVDPVQSSVIDQFSDLAIGKNGTVYVSWQRCPPTGPTGDCGGTLATMNVSKSTDGGTTWSAPVAIVSANLAPDTCGAYYGCLPNTFERVSNIPVIAIDNGTGPNAGHLYVVYYNWTGTQMKIYVTHSANGGTTWSAGVPVAPSTATHDQFFPWLNVAANGDVGATWLDRRNDPSNLMYDAYLGGSANGGKSFPLNAKLTSVMSNPNDDGFGGGFMGDYTGNTVAGSTLYASWMDMRNGSFSQDYLGGYKVH